MVGHGSAVTTANSTAFPPSYMLIQILFFRGTEQVTPGQGSFEHFIQVSFDTMRLSGARHCQADGGDYVCEARWVRIELNRSRPERLVFAVSGLVEEFPLTALPFIFCCLVV